jgi:hypothetical protein
MLPRDGKMASAGACLSHIDGLASPLLSLGAALEAGLSLQPQTAALVILQTVLTSPGAQDWQAQEQRALRAGVTAEQLDQMCTGEPLAASDEAVAALALLAGLETMSSQGAAAKAAAAFLGPARVAEVIILAGYQRLLASLEAAGGGQRQTLS